MTRNPLVITDAVLSEVLRERIRQDDRWGPQNHPLGTGPHGGQATFSGQSYGELAERMKAVCGAAHDQGMDQMAYILLEEVFEAVSESDPAKVRAEMLQVAAVAVMIIESIDRATVTTDEYGHRSDCQGCNAPTCGPPDGVYTTGIFDDAGPVPPLRPVSGARPRMAGTGDPFQDTPSWALGPLVATHRWGGEGRLHGICRCGEGRDAEIHQTSEGE